MQKIWIIAAYKRESIDEIHRVAFDYVTALENAGALVYIIPCNTPNFEQYIAEVEGFLFPGGGDIDPKLYHESLAWAQDFFTEIDVKMYECMKKAIASKKKILWICRGMQMMNIVMWGNLIQDVPNAKDHNLYEKQYEVVDTVIVENGSFLEEAFWKKQIPINSIHHQAVKNLWNGLKVSARSDFDWTIEAIEHTSLPFYGVQWHPESVKENVKLFEWFIGK